MDKNEIEKRKLTLDECAHVDENGVEYWYAREIMSVFGYSQWRRFEEAIARAETSAKASKTAGGNHFAEVGKMVELGSGSQRRVRDYILTRYACYLIAQNGDPRKATSPSRRASKNLSKRGNSNGKPKGFQIFQKNNKAPRIRAATQANVLLKSRDVPSSSQ